VGVRLRRTLALGWVLFVVVTATLTAWHVLWGGPPKDRAERAQVWGTIWAVGVGVPPMLGAWSHWTRASPAEGGRDGGGGVRVLSCYGRRYRRWVLNSSTFVDVKGLATAGDHTPRLEEVFVDVALVSRAPHRVSADPLADIRADPSERHSIATFLGLKEPVVLAVLGPPGCGKTTLLTHVALRTARASCHGLQACAPGAADRAGDAGPAGSRGCCDR
jgi:hypothetical protein